MNVMAVLLLATFVIVVPVLVLWWIEAHMPRTGTATVTITADTTAFVEAIQRAAEAVTSLRETMARVRDASASTSAAFDAYAQAYGPDDKGP